MEEYKPNSHKYKEEVKKSSEEKNITPVVKGKVTRKKNNVRKLTDTFVNEDMHNVNSYIVFDVLIPAAKKAISDIVTNGIDMILYGETGRSKNNRVAGGISYRSYYDRKDEERRYGSTRQARTRYSYDELTFESRGEAEEILERMDELIATYDFVTVADYYDLAGVTCEYTDNKYGWKDIRGADIRRDRDGGYTIKLPSVRPIDD